MSVVTAFAAAAVLALTLMAAGIIALGVHVVQSRPGGGEASPA